MPAVERGAWCPDGKALVVLLNNGDLAALAGDSKRTLHRMANKNPDPQVRRGVEGGGGEEVRGY